MQDAPQKGDRQMPDRQMHGTRREPQGRRGKLIQLLHALVAADRSMRVFDPFGAKVRTKPYDAAKAKTRRKMQRESRRRNRP